MALISPLERWRMLSHEEQSTLMAERMGVLRESRVVVHGVADASTGYGQMTAHLVREMIADGIEVGFEGFHHSEAHIPLDPILWDRLVMVPQVGPKLFFGGPGTSAPIDGSIILTMWEETRLPPGVGPNLNNFACVVVPCEDNARWFADSGVMAEIRVVPLGIDPKVYFPTVDPPSDVFRVGCAGRVGHEGDRKRLGYMAALFHEAFPTDDFPDCRLDIKCWPGCAFTVPDDPRITIVREPLTDEGLADWYRSLSTFASASYGEGWGLQPHQAMACGRPAIAPFWGGHGDYMTPESCYPVEFDAPKRCEVRPDSMVDQLRRAYLDRPGREAKGRAAAIRAAEFTWERSGRELAAIVREFGLVEASRRRGSAGQGVIRPEVRDAVNACQDRGGTLRSDPMGGCCDGPELTECRAGKGRNPGKVSLIECLDCKADRRILL